ncbi:MAG TPA: hypothetical protein VFM46_13460, partial [Pseudomonadales bacterium]|nr:hypothetical protein [Pseudomonadales bacterium]
MAAILENVFRERRLVSAGQLQSELNMFRLDLSTGLVEVTYSNGDVYYVLFRNGQPGEIYHQSNNKVTRYEDLNLLPFLSSKGEARLRICTVPLRFQRALKMLITNPNSSESGPQPTLGVVARLEQLQRRPNPAFVHAVWPSGEGFAFIPGNNAPAREFMFLSEGQVRDQSLGVTIISRWPEKECTFFIYSDSSAEAWSENYLFLGFSTTFEKIIERYDELTGRALVLRLENDLNQVGRNLSIDVFFSGKTVDDMHLFSST